MLSRAEHTILGVLLWQASSNGRKNFSTWTQDGFGSGKTHAAENLESLELGDSDPQADPPDPSVVAPFGTGVDGFSVDELSDFSVFKASTHAAFSSECDALFMSLCCNNFSICF